MTPTFDPPPMTDPYGDFDPEGAGPEGAERAEEDAINVLRAAGLGGELKAEGVDAEDARADELGIDEPDVSGADADGPAVDGSGVSEAGADGADGADGAEGDRAQRARPAGRRGRGRVPVPA
jgi:hypothetical protein